MNELRYCPECSNQLNSELVNGIVLDRCLNCAGIFFDYQELGDVLDQDKNSLSNFQNIEKGDATPDHEGIKYKCPACLGDMEDKQYMYDSGIHIDLCKNCFGVYLSNGELQQIKNYLSSTSTSNESEKLEFLGNKIIEEVMLEQKEKDDKLSQEIDDFHTTDNYIGFDKITNFIFKRM